MNLDELRSVQSKERSKDSLQHLRESFYADVGSYIRGLREERERAAERADDPFDSAEVNQLTDEIKTAEEVVEAVYERRVGKVVKRASLSAAGIPADEEGLTSEEQQLFSDLVGRIESNKTTVLDVLSGEDGGAGSTANESRAEANPVSNAETDSAQPASDDDRPTDEAAAIAGQHDANDASSLGESTPPDPSPPDEGTAREPDSPAETSSTGTASENPDHDTGTAPVDSDADTAAKADARTDAAGEAGSDLEEDRTTVRITRDVGSILGVDEREYDLETEDVVALPTENAGPLIERDAAEQID
jgi:DNA replication factor GINS